MKAEQYWQLFLETGAPELYLLYNNAKRMEQTYVSDGQGPGASCQSIQ